MKRRWLLLILCGCIASITLAVLFWPREHEPEYNGVVLSKWLEGHNGSDQAQAADAIRHIGTNALPHLLRWIQHEVPAWRKQLYKLGLTLPSSLRDNRSVQLLIVGKAEYRAAIAENGFMILGSEANAALSELQLLANNSKAPETQGRALRCMIFVAPRFPEGDFEVGARRVR